MNNPWRFTFWLVAGLLATGWLGIAGCAVDSQRATEQSVLDQAAVEATAMIQNARATALILQAQAEATALVSQAESAPISQPVLPKASTTVALPTAPPLDSETTTTGEDQPSDVKPEFEPSAEPGGRLEILSVGYGAEGAFLVVNFLADPKIAQTFWPGTLSITNESNGAVYSEVPVMPTIGPLIARPREYGQPGYFMLVNAPISIPPGSLVTVKLGEYEFKHIPIN